MKYRFLIFLTFFLIFFLFPLDSQAGDLEVCQDAGYTSVGECNQGYCINRIGNVYSQECTGCIDNPKTKVCCTRLETPTTPPNPLAPTITTCIDFNLENTLYGTTSTPSDVIKEVKPIEFVPQVTIPGTIQVGGKTFSINQGQGITVDGSLISKYIALLFNWLIGAIGVVTVAYMAYGGMEWLAAAGNASGINKAKETIRDSVVGLLLVIGSYTMLYVINPRLVGFGDLQIPDVKGNILVAIEGNENSTYNLSNSNVGGNCSKLENKPGGCSVVAVPVQNFTAASHNALFLQNQQVVNDFLAWMLDFKNTATTIPQVTSMFRTPEYQACLYNTLPSGQANKTCTSMHERGLAVDICQSCLTNSQYNILKSTALKHKFKVQNPTKGESESWHFNYQGSNVKRTLGGQDGICPQSQCAN